MDRAVDIIFSCILIVLTAPLMAIVAVAIKLDGPGPIICRTEGIWLDGRRRTNLLRFRTTAYRAGGMSRTRVGRYLYLTHIDELPELFDVLRGYLSIFSAQTRTLVASRRPR
jgi:lipopolysaccharide/colanic/teichoic acid biosynthesis glycosyltransferase